MLKKQTKPYYIILYINEKLGEKKNLHIDIFLQPVEYPPRPMTSLLKEKLDLKLDLTTRRIQSAGPVDRSRSSHSPHSPRNTPSSSPDKHKVNFFFNYFVDNI